MNTNDPQKNRRMTNRGIKHFLRIVMKTAIYLE